MKIVFVSNYYNHHQHALSLALHRCTGGNYTFIETSQMREERRKMGYGMERLPDYVKKSFPSDNDMESCRKLIDQADVLIAGSAPEHLIAERIRKGKLVLRYSERPLRRGREWAKYLPRLVRWHLRNPVNKPVYLLCASAYTASDYARFGLFRNKAYRWGYFTELKRYEDPVQLIRNKNRTKILWVARLIPLKHPENVIGAASRLRSEGYRFDLDIIGIGPMEEQLRQMIRDSELTDCVHLLGAMKPEQVREHMEQAGIFLFTSDRQEGWGAVLNESMNSGCAVVASHAIGAVPYLIEDGKNGLVYRSGDVDMLYEKVKFLLDHPETQCRLGIGAYETIAETWNGEVAACRLMELSERILSGEKNPDLWENGPCSRAKVIDESWYKEIDESD